MTTARKTVASKNAPLATAKQIPIRIPTRKDAGISPTAKLDAFTLADPHKTGGGWNKTAAYEASIEYAQRVMAELSDTEKKGVEKAMKLMATYTRFAGWKNPVKALAASFGLTRYEVRD